MYRRDWRYSVDWYAVQDWTVRILAALAILIVTHFVAKAVQWAVARLVDRIPALKKHDPSKPGETVGGQLGTLAYWLVWLVGLIAALQPLGLGDVLSPVAALTDETFRYIPNILGAGLIFFLGLIIARIARNIVEAALSAMNFDRWIARAGFGRIVGEPHAQVTPADPAAPTPAAMRISRVIGLLVYAILVILAATAALDALGIRSISVPLITILDSIAVAIPRVIGAALVMALAFFIARMVASLIEQVLPSLGFDRSVGALGAFPEGFSASRAVALIAMTAILLFAAIAAVDLLAIPTIELMLVQVVDLGARVLFGGVIILVGFVLARVVANVAARSTGDSGLAPEILRYATIALAVAIGLRFMGLANEIVNLAFGLILGAAAVAFALAFGLGGRPTAHKLLERWTDGGGAPRAPMPPPPPPAPDIPRPPKAPAREE